jgi:hypothetical protein
LKRKRIERFYLVVVDRDQGQFTVEGPMTDDTEWNEAVCAAQKDGRKVNCSSSPGPRARLEQDFARDHGFRLVQSGSIVAVGLP